MNIEKIKATAALLRKTSPSKFDMAAFAYTKFDCGTCACIAGWVYISDHPNVLNVRKADFEAFDYARDALGLTQEQAVTLFLPPNMSVMRATPEEAARVLDNLVATGEVDWRARHA